MVGRELFKLSSKVNNTPYKNCVRSGGYMSNIEQRRHKFLLSKESLGFIEKLAYQERININVNGKFVCDYIADFTYYRDGKKIYEDTKSGSVTQLFSIKKKLLSIVYNIDVVVVTDPNKF